MELHFQAHYQERSITAQLILIHFFKTTQLVLCYCVYNNTLNI